MNLEAWWTPHRRCSSFNRATSTMALFQIVPGWRCSFFGRKEWGSCRWDTRRGKALSLKAYGVQHAYQYQEDGPDSPYDKALYHDQQTMFGCRFQLVSCCSFPNRLIPWLRACSSGMNFLQIGRPLRLIHFIPSIPFLSQTHPPCLC